jgi:hypothetical protein
MLPQRCRKKAKVHPNAAPVGKLPLSMCRSILLFFRDGAAGDFLRYCIATVGPEVGTCLTRESPVASWTRGAWMTPTGARGRDALERVS